MHVPSAWIGCVVVPYLVACGAGQGGSVTTSDGGDAGLELAPCEAALAAWEQGWEIEVESSGLEGSTPEINLMDVFGLAPDDVYAVGFSGHVLHFDGERWSEMDAGTGAYLEGVWGFAIEDGAGAVVCREVFAAGFDPESGEAVILRYDGAAWMPQRIVVDHERDSSPVRGHLHDIWGVAPAGPDEEPEVIAVGGEGLILSWDPEQAGFSEMRREELVDYTCGDEICTRTAWVRWTPEKLAAIFAAAPGDFVTVGNNGAILEGDGSGWSRRHVREGFITHLAGVWGTGSQEVFAVGLDGTILRRRNGTWRDYREEAEAQDGHLSVPPVFLRAAWGYHQPGCAPGVDGGQAPAEDWSIFAGWDQRLYLRRGDTVCPFGKLAAMRLEGIWGTSPRTLADRTLPDGGIQCDPVEVIVTGVNGTILRLTRTPAP